MAGSQRQETDLLTPQWLYYQSNGYERHFGGVIYLFLRGVDRENPQQGIYATRPDGELIALMDELFAGVPLEEMS